MPRIAAKDFASTSEPGFMSPADKVNLNSCGKFVVPFSAASPSPLVVGLIPAGTVVWRVEIAINSPFSPGATLTIGDFGDNSRLLAADDNDPSRSGDRYRVEPDLEYPSGGQASLYIAGAPVLGTGTVVLLYR